MKTIYTTSSFFGWISACIINALIVWGCNEFASMIEWQYLDLAFFLYLVILMFYFICLKLDEGFPALFRQVFLRKRFLLINVSAYEVTIVLVSVFHIVKAIILYREAIVTLF